MLIAEARAAILLGQPETSSAVVQLVSEYLRRHPRNGSPASVSGMDRPELMYYVRQIDRSGISFRELLTDALRRAVYKKRLE